MHYYICSCVYEEDPWKLPPPCAWSLITQKGSHLFPFNDPSYTILEPETSLCINGCFSWMMKISFTIGKWWKMVAHRQTSISQLHCLEFSAGIFAKVTKGGIDGVYYWWKKSCTTWYVYTNLNWWSPDFWTINSMKKSHGKIIRIFARVTKAGIDGVYGCFLKWWYPQNTPKWSFLVGKPMVVGETHHFRKHPYEKTGKSSGKKNTFSPGLRGVLPGYYHQVFGKHLQGRRIRIWWEILAKKSRDS